LITQYEREILSLREDLVSIQARKDAAEKQFEEVMGSLQESTAVFRDELDQVNNLLFSLFLIVFS
jgi:hypothetical protein